VHCKGSLSRACIIAARLLVEFGRDAQQAITDVQAARASALQVAEQKAYVRPQRRMDAAGRSD
jgi:hypothetical protein